MATPVIKIVPMPGASGNVGDLIITSDETGTDINGTGVISLNSTAAPGWINLSAYEGAYVNGTTAQNKILTQAKLSAINTNLLPSADNQYSLGSAQYRWKDIHLGQGTIFITDSVTGDEVGLSVDNGVFFIDGIAQAQLPVLELDELIFDDQTTHMPASVTVSDGVFNIGGIAQAQLPNVAVTNLTFPDNSVQTIAYQGNASGINGSYGSFYDEHIQTGTANSIQAMHCDTEDFSDGISLQGTPEKTRITMADAGKYNIAFSAQLFNQANGALVQIWLNKNGTPVPNSNTKVHMSANLPYAVAAWNFFVNANAGDYYQIMWSSNDSTTSIRSEAATGSGATLKPAIPSVIITVNQVGA